MRERPFVFGVLWGASVGTAVALFSPTNEKGALYGIVAGLVVFGFMYLYLKSEDSHTPHTPSENLTPNEERTEWWKNAKSSVAQEARLTAARENRPLNSQEKLLVASDRLPTGDSWRFIRKLRKFRGKQDQ